VAKVKVPEGRWTKIGVIAGVVGVGLAAYFGFSSLKSPASYFQGSLLKSVNVETTPSTTAPPASYLSVGTPVFIVCTKNGDPVTGPRRGGGINRTNIWDYIQTSTSSKPVGYVPDVWVETGTTKRVAHPCR